MAEPEISQKRDYLHSVTVKVSMLFLACVAVLVAAFKQYETYLDAADRTGFFREYTDRQEGENDIARVNVRLQPADEKNAGLAIPLTAPADADKVSIREEFTKNKFIITLAGYSEKIAGDLDLVSGTEFTDSVGIYRQGTDLVVEICCKKSCVCELMPQTDALVVNFKDIDECYDRKVIVWFSCENKNVRVPSEWKQRLAQSAGDKRIGLYIADGMMEEYTQKDVIDFANRIHADMAIGVQVKAADTQQAYMECICNPDYFIPEFNSAQLAVIMAEIFSETADIRFSGFGQSGEKDPLVSEAVVPAALIQVFAAQDNTGIAEKIMASVERTIDGVRDFLDKEERMDEN